MATADASQEGRKLLYERYYSTQYATAGNDDLRATIAFYDRCFAWALPAGVDGPMLDIGAGLGHLVAWLKQKGITNASGIDHSPEQCSASERATGVAVRHVENTLDFLSKHQGEYSVIFMSDVIEHLPKWSIPEHLVAIRNALRPGGALVVKTDNVASPIGLYQHRMDFTHEYTFTERSLTQVLAAAGFDEIEIRGEQYDWSWRYPPSIVHAAVRRVWFKLLASLYAIERPCGNNPTIFSKSLICRAAMSSRAR